MHWRIIAAVSLVVGSVAFGEDAVQRKAREELERELKQMVGTPPTRVRVDFVSPDEPNYKLEEASFEVDGNPVPPQSPEALAAEGTHPVFSGEVTPGKHKVSAKLVFANKTSAVLSDEGGYKWKIGGDATFEVTPGLEVQVQIVPARDSKQKDIGKRFTLRMPAAPVMVAKLDDGKMPEPMAKSAEVPKILAAEKAAEQKAAVDEATKKMTNEARDENRRPSTAKVPTGSLAVGEPTRPGPAAAVAVAEADVDAGVTEVATADLAPAGMAEDAGVTVAAKDLAPITEPLEQGPNGLMWLLVGGGLVMLFLVIVVMRRRARD